MVPKINIIGGGLAGCEAAWQCLQAGLSVKLYEKRPKTMTEAHKTGNLAELVCSNSLKSLDSGSPSGLLKDEMQQFDSLILEAAYKAKVPAGGALAVDREVFSGWIEKSLSSHKNFERLDAVVEDLSSFPKDELVIVATGPLTDETLGKSLLEASGEDGENLYFYDAIAPVIDADSIDRDHCFVANRYGKGEGDGDYINIPLDKEEYETFINEVEKAEMSPLHHFESTKYFESCLPIEVMVERGRETLRFGPMKPVGLEDPETGKRAWAVIQLRRENADGTMYSMVGFQTKMKWGEQKRIFSMIPALKNAEFLRLGSVHRNTYLKSPKILNSDLSLKNTPNIFLAGQITGVEGYLESSAIGLLAGRYASSRTNEKEMPPLPATTMLGALYNYVTKGSEGPYQPMNTNMGLLPSLEWTGKKIPKKEKRAIMCSRAREDLATYFNNIN